MSSFKKAESDSLAFYMNRIRYVYFRQEVLHNTFRKLHNYSVALLDKTNVASAKPGQIAKSMWIMQFIILIV
ncbi:MAG: hypothetical protein BGN96_05780 [Bacteroidales bacterium 45-6]|nr:MAG: hypothetical protein BGN96_05780 [Bacteroidales bacterium 45-6]